MIEMISFKNSLVVRQLCYIEQSVSYAILRDDDSAIYDFICIVFISKLQHLH